jgi:hypothetical protein
VSGLVAAGVSLVMLASVGDRIHAQAFANLKNALVDYSQSRIAPHLACAELAKLRDKEIVELQARKVPAAIDDAVNFRCMAPGR